jgi:adenosylmethionine-8-amino-7-oxononanoate aminotransferase
MIARGEGIYLYDQEGKRYIDGSGGPLVVNVGHGRPEIIEAMQRQLESVAYVHAIMFTSEVVETYAAELAQVVNMPDPRFYFLSSGSEVVEAAIKLARQIQIARGEDDRHLIISRHMSYHGMTLGALSVSGRPPLRKPYIEMLNEWPHVQPPYPYRNDLTGEQAAKELEQVILEYGPARVAAFIAEPISGASLGAAVPPSDYWPWIRQVCDRYGVLLIADEVLVGFGRTGKWWALEHWDISPDIMVTAKGAAGGYFPFGIVGASQEDVSQVQCALGDFNHGGTFSHHPVGAAAALAALRIIKGEDLVDHAARMGVLLGAKLQSGLGHLDNVGDVRGRGLFWGIEIVKDRQTKQPFPASRHIAWQLWQKAFERGLVVYYSQGCADGVNGDIIMVGPPLIVNEAQLDELVAILVDTLDDYFRQEQRVRP